MPENPPILPNNQPQGRIGAITASNPDAIVVGTTTINIQPENDIFQNQSPINEEAYKGGLITNYVIKNIYQKDLQIYMVGNTNSRANKKVSFLKLCNSTLIWICDWTASRQGGQPTQPDPNPQDSEWVLLDRFIEPHSMTLLDGGTPLWRLTGTYVYGHINPDKADLVTLVNYPRPPWIDNSLTRTISESTYEQNLSNVTNRGTGIGEVPFIPGNPNINLGVGPFQ